MALASYPGFSMTTPPSREEADRRLLAGAGVGRRAWRTAWCSATGDRRDPADARAGRRSTPLPRRGAAGVARAGRPDARRARSGTLCGARSGDKGGNANVGVWVRSAEAYAWLERVPHRRALRALLPEARELEVERYELPNLLAVNFVLKGLLGDGVAASLRATRRRRASASTCARRSCRSR